MRYSEHKISTNEHIVLPRKNSHVLCPLPPHNGHLSTMATFFCPQGDRFGEVPWWLYYIHYLLGVYVAKNLLKAMHEST